MDPIWVALLTFVVPALIVLAGRLFDKRRGIPTGIDGAIDSHVQFVVEALKEEIEQRKRSADDCERKIVEQSARIASLEHDKDKLEAQVNRLLLKIDGGTP